MQDEELNREKFPTLIKFVSELNEIQHQLDESDKIKEQLEKELSQLKADSCTAMTLLETELINSNAEKEILREKAEYEIKERNRAEEEFRTVKTSLEGQLTRSESEKELITKNLQAEIQARKAALDKLQKSIDELYEFDNINSGDP
jgi:multidrug efflux pump subunit AcrA (membrane-fusion protein)